MQSIGGQNVWGTGTTTFTMAVLSFVGVDTGSKLALNGVLSGADSLNKVGGGTLEFRGPVANTYTGITTIDAGTLR